MVSFSFWRPSRRGNLRQVGNIADPRRSVFYWSFDGNEWSGPFDLHAVVAADGQFIGSSYTTTANFGRIARFAIASRATTGTNQEGAVGSGVLEVTWRS